MRSTHFSSVKCATHPCFSPCVVFPKMARSPWSTPPRSSRCLWADIGLADSYPDSDHSELLSGGGSSDRADSEAADYAFNAAVESQVEMAADAAAADAVAVCFVRSRLAECGIVGPAATFLMATSMADLRAVAVEVLGDDSLSSNGPCCTGCGSMRNLVAAARC